MQKQQTIPLFALLIGCALSWLIALNAHTKEEENFSRIEKLIKLQVSSESLGTEISQSLKKGKTLSGGQINRLSQVIDHYHRLLSPLIIEARKKPLDQMIQGYDEENLMIIMLHTEITRQLFSLLKTYFQDHDLRRLVIELLRYHPSENNIVKESFEKAKYFLSKNSIHSLIFQLQSLQDFIKEEELQNLNHDELKYISIIIRDDLTPMLQRGPKLPRNSQIILDSTASLINTLTEYGSWIVGNAAGSIQWRKGYLLKHEETLKQIRFQLRPFDILVEKAPFILTDYMIPGHFGHAALYLGDEEQLRELELWHHPAITPYHDQIRSGNTIIEAVRSGVRLTSFENFINVDELAIVRLKSLDQAPRMLSVAMKQMYKEYDFNFDVRNPLTVVCSELIYLTMGHISWPTETVLGRPTVSPDHLVELAFYRNSPIEYAGHWKANAKSVQNLSEVELAEKLQFVPVAKSAFDSLLYDRRVLSCEQKINRRIRVNSTRSGYLETTVCHQQLVTNTYQAEEIDNSEFQKLMRSRAR